MDKPAPFLKLLEAQIFKFHGEDDTYKFLSTDKVRDFKDLSDLFFKVLASTPADRPPHIQEKFDKVPYLNSSLFELTPLERTFRITSLTSDLNLPVHKKTVLKDSSGRRQKGAKQSLTYIFEFLDAYDFGAVGRGDVREDSKTIINAAVLGLIFEKINGYRDGAIFTPGFITMYMARNAIEKTVIQAFQKANPTWILNDIDDLRNNITDRSKASVLALNAVIDRIKICDPAVGSGHFLVSCLNELIALKSRLGILADSEGNRLSEFSVEVDNDELIVLNAVDDEVFVYRVYDGHVPKTLQSVQKLLFHEKQKLIEGCLFGVDININSVRICQLRLWIELLKNAYYRDGKEGPLETLPNIDINIKCGNSLLFRFGIDQNLSDAFNKAGLTVASYRKLVNDYKSTKDKATKRDLLESIAKAKSRFEEDELGRLTRKIDLEIIKLREKEAQEDFFSLDDPEQLARRDAKLSDIRAAIKALEADRDKLLQKKTFVGALEWRFEFPEVLDEKGRFLGFDLIIANPPYGVSISEPARTHITRALAKVPDYEIYYYFLNLASLISTQDGNSCQIVPNTVLFNLYAKSYRDKILHDWKDIQIDDLTAFPVFDGVVVHNIIFHGRRRLGRDGVQFRRTGHDTNVLSYLDRPLELATPSTLEENNKNWGLVFRLDPLVVEVVSKIRNVGQTLGAYFPRISQGLIAYDRYRGQSPEVIKARAYHLMNATDTSSSWLKGEDVTRFLVQWNGREYIEYGAHLANPRKPEFFSDPRILIREITNPTIFAGYTDKVLYNDPAIINVLVEDDKVFPRHTLLAILNSKLASYYHFHSSPKALKGAFPKILVDDVRSFPVPDVSANVDLVAVIARRTELIIEEVIRGGDTEALDRQNDTDVMALYGLDAVEQAIVLDYFSSTGLQEAQ